MGRSVFLKLFGVIVGACIAIAGASAKAAPHASFDCAKASRPVDKLICGDDDLAALDVKVAAAYKAALAAKPAESDSLRDAQRAWIQKRDKDCLDETDSRTCLAQAYLVRLAELSARSMPGGGLETVVITSLIVPLEDRALTVAHPAERSEMGFPQGTFSPKGDVFAFAVDNIVSGDPDQIWLYRLADKKLVPATTSPVKGKTSVNIDSFSWVGDTLYIEGSSGNAGDALTPFKRAATMAGAHDVAAIPKAPPPPNLARDTTAEGADELSDMGDKRMEDAHYVVTSTNGGHGAITLSAYAKSGGPEWTIAQGTWNLAAFVYDAPRGRVLYGDETRGLVAYDLRTKKTTVLVPVAVGTLLDVTADGKRAAYRAYGSCTAPPGKPAGRTQMICFARAL